MKYIFLIAFLALLVTACTAKQSILIDVQGVETLKIHTPTGISGELQALDRLFIVIGNDLTFEIPKQEQEALP